MNKSQFKLWKVLALIFTVQFAQAQVVNTQGMTLNGIASFERLRKEHYVGALYLTEASNFPDYVLAMPGKKVMDIRITIDEWTARNFTSIWTEAMLINNSDAVQNKNKEFIMKFGELLKGDLKKGDQLQIAFTPKVGTNIVLNGTTLYSTPDENLFNLMLNTWIGARPYSSDFKRDLLNYNNNAELTQRHQETKPEKQRIAATASWAPKKEEETKPEPTKTELAKSESKPAAKPTESKPEVAKAKTEAPKKPESVAASAESKAAPTSVSEAPKPIAQAEPVKTPDVAAANQAALLEEFRANVIRRTYQYTQYPERSVHLKQEGVVILKLKIDRNGKLAGFSEEQASGFKTLDKAAEIAVKKSQPFPAPPTALQGEIFEINVPFNFKL